MIYFWYFPINNNKMDIKPDPYRYVNWALYFFAAMISNAPVQVFSGVSPIIRDVYKVTEVEANSVSLLFAFCCVLLLFPANYVIDQKGIKVATLICTLGLIKIKYAQ